MKLTIVLATRGRPELLASTIKETLKHIREPDTRIVIDVDGDDLSQPVFSDPRIIWSYGPRPDSLGAKYNRGMKFAPADVYLAMVDYAPHITDGFDTRILEAAQTYSDGYAVIVSHLANASFSQINAVTHKLATAMGGMYPEHFPYWFVDHWLEEMARRIGRMAFCDVQLDLSQRPDTVDGREPYLWGLLYNALEPERRQIAEKIIDSDDFMETPERKAALKRNWPMIVEQSERINRVLQRDPGRKVDKSDARYMRLREAALKVIPLPIEFQRPPSLFIATPMYGGQCYGSYTNSLLQLNSLCHRYSIPFHFFTLFNESHIDRGRNICVDEFLKSEMSHMMFIDSDISFQPESVLELIECNKEIVCGFYPKKRIDWKTIVKAVKSGLADKDPEILTHFVGDMVFSPALNDDSNRYRSIYDLTLLHEGGTGFMMIKREVFEKIKVPKYTKAGPGSELISCYFDAKVEFEPYARHLSEDFDFCRLAREAGIEIWLAPWIKLIHHGYYQFVGNVEAISAARQPIQEAAE